MAAIKSAVPSDVQASFVKAYTLDERLSRDLTGGLEESFVTTGATTFELLERLKDHKQNAFSTTSERISVAKTKGCLIEVIITERHISCESTCDCVRVMYERGIKI